MRKEGPICFLLDLQLRRYTVRDDMRLIDAEDDVDKGKSRVEPGFVEV